MDIFQVITDGVSNFWNRLEAIVCEETGLFCSEELSERTEKVEILEKLPNAKLEELLKTEVKEQRVGCYLQLHRVGCYEQLHKAPDLEQLNDPKFREQLLKELKEIERQWAPNEMIIMPKRRFMMMERMDTLIIRESRTLVPSEKPSNLPPPGCTPGSVGP